MAPSSNAFPPRPYTVSVGNATTYKIRSSKQLRYEKFWCKKYTELTSLLASNFAASLMPSSPQNFVFILTEDEFMCLMPRRAKQRRRRIADVPIAASRTRSLVRSNPVFDPRSGHGLALGSGSGLGIKFNSISN